MGGRGVMQGSVGKTLMCRTNCAVPPSVHAHPLRNIQKTAHSTSSSSSRSSVVAVVVLAVTPCRCFFHQLYTTHCKGAESVHLHCWSNCWRTRAPAREREKLVGKKIGHDVRVAGPLRAWARLIASVRKHTHTHPHTHTNTRWVSKARHECVSE